MSHEERAVGNKERFQCPTMVYPDKRCFRAEFHEGPCMAGPSGSTYDCKNCGRMFATLAEFDAHVPCSA
jgi:hypothetical protein